MILYATSILLLIQTVYYIGKIFYMLSIGKECNRKIELLVLNISLLVIAYGALESEHITALVNGLGLPLSLFVAFILGVNYERTD